MAHDDRGGSECPLTEAFFSNFVVETFPPEVNILPATAYCGGCSQFSGEVDVYEEIFCFAVDGVGVEWVCSG